jgi:hypothetical protein
VCCVVDTNQTENTFQNYCCVSDYAEIPTDWTSIYGIEKLEYNEIVWCQRTPYEWSLKMVELSSKCMSVL